MTISLPIPPERLIERSRLQRYFGDDPKENAFIRAKNLVLQGSFDRTMIEYIGQEYELDIAAEFHSRWVSLFREIMYHLFQDGEFDASEKAFAKEYVAIFRLQKEEIDKIIQSVGSEVFINRLLISVGPEGLEKEEAARLSKFAKQIGLRDTKETYVETVSGVLQSHIAEMLEDDLLTPHEYQRVHQMAKALRIEMSFDNRTQRLIDAAQHRWEVINKPLTRITVKKIRLDAGEDAYHAEWADWYETRKIRTNGESINKYKVIYSGCVVLTDKRLLMFDDLGGSTKSIKWTSLLAIHATGKEEIELIKSSGKSPVIKYHTQPESPSIGPIIAERLFKGNH